MLSPRLFVCPLQRRELLGQAGRLSEEVAHAGQSLWQRPDRPPVGCQLWIVQLLPGDRRRDRSAGRGTGRIWRHQRAIDGVLGEVEPGATTAIALRPFPADELGDRLANRAREELDPV